MAGIVERSALENKEGTNVQKEQGIVFFNISIEMEKAALNEGEGTGKVVKVVSI